MVSLSSRNNTWHETQMIDKYRPFRSDKRWVATKMKEILDAIEAEHWQKEQDSRENREHIRMNTLLKIRLLHAWMDNANRDRLMEMFDIFKRMKIESRISADRDLTIFELTVGNYNRHEYLPRSHALGHLHPKFSQPMNLEFPEGATKMTADGAAKIIKDLLSMPKKSDANWRASGNGKGNKKEDGRETRVRLIGANYSAVDKELAEDAVIEYVDDDRWQFCNDNLVLAYLWGLLDELGLSTFVVQNCAQIGLENGKCASTRAANGLLPGRSNTRREKTGVALENAINKLPELMKDCMSDLFSGPTQRERMDQLQDHIRRQSALHSTCRSDLKAAKLDLL
jgi:hypothetical protein